MRLSPPVIVATLVALVCVACGKVQSTPAALSSGAGTQGELRTALASPEYKKHVQEKRDLMQKEEQVIEQADWFGKTGLSDSVERELPRYLRREYGQSISDKGALRADSLQYLGVYPEGLGSIHFWRIVDGAQEPRFAYISVSPTGDTVLGWGGKRPPARRT